MKTLAPILALIATAAVAQAEIAIQSGEHDSFSRLVLTLPPGTEWEIEKSDRNVRIELSDRTQTFDTSTIFDFIPRDRLAEARDLGAGVLGLTLECTCEVDAFRFGDQYLVLDIEDGNEPERPKARAPVLPVVLDNRPRGPVPPLGFAIEPEPVDELADRQPSLSEAREQLLTELGRAASQGLVTAKPVTRPEPNVVPDTQTARQEAAPVPIAPPEQLSSNINLHAETSLDTALSNALTRAFPSDAASRCFSGEVLAVETWANDRDYQQQAGMLNRRLYREFDKIDDNAVKDLMRFYVHHGFGAEALFTARLMETSDAETEVIKTMARILDDLPLTGVAAFTGQHDCDTPASMWAVLSSDTLDPAIEINETAIRRSFSALPVHLRQHLAPPLSATLRNGGYRDLAEHILRTGNRGSTEPSADVRLAEAQLDVDLGDLEEAEAAMTELIKEDAAPSPRALVELVDLRISNGEPVDTELATLAAAYAFQHAGTPLGQDLKRAEILALADSGQFLAALDQIDSFDLQSDRVVADTIGSVMDLASAHASDETFLRMSVGFLGTRDVSLRPETSNAVARRLLDLGITDQVPSLLAPGASGEIGQDRRVLRARLAIMTGRPRNAIAHLIGMNGDAVTSLRAEAFAALDEHERARDAFQSAGQTERSYEQAVLARNWEHLSAQGTAPLAEFALSRTKGEREQGPASLQAGAALLDESRDTLNRVNALLESFQVSTVIDESNATE